MVHARPILYFCAMHRSNLDTYLFCLRSFGVVICTFYKYSKHLFRCGFFFAYSRLGVVKLEQPDLFHLLLPHD